MAPTKPDRTVGFSPFVVDLQTGELRKKGAKVRLQDKSFQILAALLERPAELVSREELRLFL
jgi:DNA-binding winged helix-turn-helix (wHTH) protein